MCSTAERRFPPTNTHYCGERHLRCSEKKTEKKRKGRCRCIWVIYGTLVGTQRSNKK